MCIKFNAPRNYMFWIWLIVAAVVYFAVLSGILVFFAAVSRMNHHWERVLNECQGSYDRELRRAA